MVGIVPIASGLEAVTMLGHFVRFAPNPRWRNISAFGMLDEIRHAQLFSRVHDA
jgi:hypothetical protein